MWSNPQTTDNLLLSRVTLAPSDPHEAGRIAVNCTDSILPPGPEPSEVNCTENRTISPEAKALIACSLAANTERAYRADLAHFIGWGGTLPASPAMVADYIATYAGVLSVATLQRRASTLAMAHAALGVPNPCKTEIVRATLRGAKRRHGTAQQQAKPLLRDDLFAILDQMGTSIADQRDRALLLLGFAGSFRRSELTGLMVEDLTPVRQGLAVTLRRSKTDQDGAGRQIGIPHGRTRHCPVAAVETWLTTAGITAGAMFRPVSRHGHLSSHPLTGDAVSAILRRQLAAVGINPEGYSGHSLRAGFATSAAQAGVATHKIRAQTGHASDAMLSRYIREAGLFTDNAAGALL